MAAYYISYAHLRDHALHDIIFLSLALTSFLLVLLPFTPRRRKRARHGFLQFALFRHGRDNLAKPMRKCILENHQGLADQKRRKKL